MCHSYFVVSALKTSASLVPSTFTAGTTWGGSMGIGNGLDHSGWVRVLGSRQNRSHRWSCPTAEVVPGVWVSDEQCWQQLPSIVTVQARNQPNPFLYEIFTAPHCRGIECALWPVLYHRTDMCESVLEGQANRVSSKISFMHKILSPVVDYSFSFDLLQYNYDRWLFKTITGAVNSSKASGCSPNRSLENKAFSRTFWQHQHFCTSLTQCASLASHPSLWPSVPTNGHFRFPRSSMTSATCTLRTSLTSRCSRRST